MFPRTAVIAAFKKPNFEVTPPAQLRGPVRFVCTSRLPTRAAQIAGIDERPELIGAAAADRLASMVERRKPTLTLAPQSTLLTGRWID